MVQVTEVRVKRLEFLMAQDPRLTRSMVGMLMARLPGLGLDEVVDGRSEHGMRWKLPSLLTAMLMGMVTGSRSLSDVERLTDELGKGARRRFRIPRRVPDSTMRDTLVDAIDPMDACGLIRRSADAAYRRKAFQHRFPLRVAAMDGKATAVQELDRRYAQVHSQKNGLAAIGLVRTITCALVTALGRPILEAVPMGGRGNEVGFFETAFGTLLEHHAEKFDLVTYDAGAYSVRNAKAVVDAKKQYLFGLKNESRFLMQKAKEKLGRHSEEAALAFTEDVLAKGENVRVFRYLFAAETPNGYKQMRTVRTILRVLSVKVNGMGEVLATEDRYFISSLPHGSLLWSQWLELVRMHWGVETCHNILDVAFLEDKHPWITHSARGMLVLALLRRVAYNLMTLYRSVSLRDDNRLTPWATLLDRMKKALEQATEEFVAALRPRKALCARS